MVEGGRVSIERQTDFGHDTVECGLPALVTLTAAAAEPRHPSLRETIEAKKKPIERLSLADLGLDADDVRPTQHVTSVEIAPEQQAGELIDEAEAPGRIVRCSRKRGSSRWAASGSMRSSTRAAPSAPSALELLTKARSLGADVAAVALGPGARRGGGDPRRVRRDDGLRRRRRRLCGLIRPSPPPTSLGRARAGARARS